jgi:plasmid stability protein
METLARCDTFLGVKVPKELATELRRRALQDGRTTSDYTRRLLTDALAREKRTNRLGER